MIRRTAGALVLAATLGCLGCGAAPDLPAKNAGVVDDAKSPIEHHEEIFAGARGVKLHAEWWRPRQGKPRGALVIVHGLKDYGARYGELATRLANDGFAVYAADLRGHGRSGGPRVTVDTFDDYTDDLDIFMDRVMAREPHTHVFLFGHSMGGAIAALYTITYHPDLHGLILSGAALEVDASGITVASSRAMNGLAPNAGLFQLDLHDFSRDPNVVKDGLADPLVYQDAAPVHTAVELVDAIHTIQARESELDLPLLVLHGKADKVTPPSGSEALYGKAKSTDKKLVEYDGLYHDLLHEPEKAKVEKDIQDWLDAHAPKADAPAPTSPPPTATSATAPLPK